MTDPGGLGADLQDFKITMLLCDSAQVVAGKLYILGGGWSRVPAGHPIPIAIAAKVDVPWHKANEQLEFKLKLVGEDGQPVLTPPQPPATQGDPVEVVGNLEVGRPPGLRQGTPLDTAIAVNTQLPLPPGRYRWEFWIDGRPLAATGFDVVPVAQVHA